MLIHSKGSSVHLLTPSSQSTPLPPPPLGNHKSILQVHLSSSLPLSLLSLVWRTHVESWSIALIYMLSHSVPCSPAPWLSAPSITSPCTGVLEYCGHCPSVSKVGTFACGRSGRASRDSTVGPSLEEHCDPPFFPPLLLFWQFFLQLHGGCLQYG